MDGRNHERGGLIIVWPIPNALTMLLCHRGTLVRVGVQPVQYQRLDHTLGIGQVSRAIVLERFEHLCVEAIGALDGPGLLR